MLNAPADQILKFFELRLKEDEEEFERERSKLWLNYLMQIFTQPSTGNESVEYKRAKEQFVDIISPTETIAAPSKKYEWDFEITELEQAGI